MYLRESFEIIFVSFFVVMFFTHILRVYFRKKIKESIIDCVNKCRFGAYYAKSTFTKYLKNVSNGCHYSTADTIPSRFNKRITYVFNFLP